LVSTSDQNTNFFIKKVYAQFDRVMAEFRIIAPAIGRSICVEPVVKRGWGR
jgi:hypothetical protein